MKRTLFAIMLMAFLLLPACGVQGARMPLKSDSYSTGGATESMELPPMEAPVAAGGPQMNYDATTSLVDQNQAAAETRLVIKNVDMTIVVKDTQVKLDAISAMAERLGGFVVSSNLYENSMQNGATYLEGSIQIRVPAEKLEDALAEIKQNVVEVQSENRSGQDVTQQYTDLGSQLKNLEATEKQLTLIMEKADKTEDVLAVFNQLTQIRGQIEVIKGQMQYFEQSAALSSISVRLIAEETIAPIEIGGWKPQGVLRDAVQNLVDFLQGFFEFAVNLIIVYLPAGLLIFAVIFGLWQLLKMMWRLLRWKNPFERKSPPPVPPAPQTPSEEKE